MTPSRSHLVRLHYSIEEYKIVAMLCSYWDESAVDGGGPVSVVGGLILDHRQYTWRQENRKCPALQAADVIAWAVRRKSAGKAFNNGYEPLLDLFNEQHIVAHFEVNLMREASANLRARLGR